jgi:[ribosomal protein S18]-alanine N-acetyltransferase
MMQVRAGNDVDLDAMSTLEQTLFAGDHPISRRSLRNFMRRPTAAVLVVDRYGHFAGDAIVLFRSGTLVARLYTIGVVPEHRGHGIAQRLLRAAHYAAMCRRCVTIRLEVRVDNAAAIRLYLKHGYREFGRYARYYPDGTDALRMEKLLADAPKRSRA